MKRIVSKIKARVFVPDEPVKEYLEKWKASMIKAIPKMFEGMNNSINDLNDFERKIGQPNLKSVQNWLNPNFRGKTGIRYENVLDKMRDNIKRGYMKYKDKSKRVLESADGEESKRYQENIEMNAYQAALRISQCTFPFSGYKDLIRGVAQFAARWLSGDLTVLKLVTKADKDIQGVPISIGTAERMGEFRNALINRLKQAGARIVKSGFHPEIIQTENNLTNELVNQYLSDGFAKFATGGDSCLDYIVENGQLFLSVKVSQI